MKDYFGYEGKTCVVTGAYSGMGKAAATLLVEMGAKVYVLDCAKPELAGIEKWIPTDMSERDSIDAAFARLPEKIDRFFGIAGISGINSTFDKTFAIDFISNKYMTETYLGKRVVNGGAIAYVTSSAGVRWAKEDLIEEYRDIVDADGWDGTVEALHVRYPSDRPGGMAYMLAKRAMNYFASSRAAEFARRDIRVNYVMPCSTATHFVSEYLDKAADSKQLFLDSIGNGKDFARPEAMGKAIVYLNSDFAEYVSGHGLIVDYGLEAAVLCGQRPDTLGGHLL